MTILILHLTSVYLVLTLALPNMSLANGMSCRYLFQQPNKAERSCAIPSLCTAFLSRVKSSVTPSSLKSIEGFGSVREFEAEPMFFRRLFIEERLVKKIHDEISTHPHSVRPSIGFNIYLNSRLTGYPAWVKRRVHKIIQNVHVKNSDTLSGAYFRADQSIYLLFPSTLKGSLAHYKLLAHEIEHSIQDAEYVMRVSPGSRDHYFHEFGAIRAEWEFSRIFPDSSIQTERERVKLAPLSEPYKTQTLRSLDLVHSDFSLYRQSDLYNSRNSVESIYHLLMNGRSEP